MILPSYGLDDSLDPFYSSSYSASEGANLWGHRIKATEDNRETAEFKQ